jgi:hypothetical protein
MLRIRPARYRNGVRDLAATWYGPTHLNDLIGPMPRPTFAVALGLIKAPSQ